MGLISRVSSRTYRFQRPKIIMDQMQYLMQLQNNHVNDKNCKNRENPQNPQNLPHNQPKTADIFSFDDLLVTCAHEIMVNGLETTVLPPTIKDWVSGKIVQALPHRLIQKLLGFLIDNRDMTDTIAYKEKNHGEVPEFTLLLYRTAKAKVRHEKNNDLKNNDLKNMDLKNMDFGKNTTDKISRDTNLFNDETLNGDVLKFFSDEIVVEQSRTIPVKTEISENFQKYTRKIYQKEKRHSDGETDSDSEVSPAKKLIILNPSHTTSDPHLPSEADNRYS